MNAGEKTIVGSWLASFEAPDTGAFPGLLIFTGDGCVITSEAPGPYESAGMGSWTAAGPNTVGYTFYYFNGGADNKLTAKGKVVGQVHYDPGQDCWDGPWRIEIADAQGKLTFTTKGPHTGKRIAVESV